MKNFFKSAKFKVIVCVLTASLCGMLLAAFTSTSESPLTSIAGVIYMPFQKAAAQLVEKTRDWEGSFASASGYKEQIKELESDILEYNEMLVDYERTKLKLESYEAMLGVKNENPDYNLVAASVISKNTADAYDSITIDKGSSSGIAVNNPVVYGENVVGIVKEVGLTTCVVKTILDPSVNISVYEIKSRESGYSNTTAALSYDGLCRMSGLSKETSVAAGGIVCTSGLGGIFPRDLVVGTVSVLKNEETDMSVYAIIDPAVDVRSVNDVFVITDFISDVG